MQCPDEHAAVCAALRVHFILKYHTEKTLGQKSPLVAAPTRLREDAATYGMVVARSWHEFSRDSLLICEDWVTTWMPWTTVLSNPVRCFLGRAWMTLSLTTCVHEFGASGLIPPSVLLLHLLENLNPKP